MGKSTTQKLWCIRILSGAAYLFKGGKKVESFLNIIGADEVTVNTSPAGTSSSVSGSSPTVKKLLKKRNLSEVFTMVQLSGEGWKHFQA